MINLKVFLFVVTSASYGYVSTSNKNKFNP